MTTVRNGIRFNKLLAITIAIICTAILCSADPYTIPRVGDSIIGYRIGYINQLFSDTTKHINIDISRNYKVRLAVYRAGADSIHLTLDGISKLLSVKNDSIFMLSNGQRGLSLISHIPEPEFETPSAFTYYRTGNAGGIDFREFGIVNRDTINIDSLTFDSELIINEALILRTIYSGNLQIAPKESPLDWSLMMGSIDSINSAIDNFTPLSDSICKVSIIERIYAQGYRYPLILQEKCILYAYGTISDSIKYAYAFPPLEQNYLDDTENSNLRNLLYNKAKITSNSASTSSEEISSNESTFTFSASPNLTHNKITAKICTHIPSTYSLLLTNFNGMVIWTDELSVEAGEKSFTIDLSPYISGIYIVTASDGRSSIPIRIAKI